MITVEADIAAAVGWRGARALSPDGRRVGDVVGLIVDRQTGKPVWLLLHTRGRGYRCTPLHDTIGRADRVHVPWDPRAVAGGPPVPADGGLSVRNEQELCAYYRVPATRGARLSVWERRRTTGLASVAPDGTIVWTPGPREDSAVRPAVVEVPGPPVRRVLIADPHTAALPPLRAAIDAHPGLRVAAVLRDGPPALSAARTDAPDVLVLSLQMALLGGLEVRDRIHAANAEVVTVLLDYGSVGTVQRLDARTMLVSALAGPHVVVTAIDALLADADAAHPVDAAAGSSPGARALETLPAGAPVLAPAGIPAALESAVAAPGDRPRIPSRLPAEALISGRPALAPRPGWAPRTPGMPSPRRPQ